MSQTPNIVFAGFTGDRSGSMGSMKNALSDGLFGWINEQKKSVEDNSQVGKFFVSTFDDKHEIRIGTLFKKAPESFLAMIVVHELAHLKEKEHNKAFYKLCQSMLPDYHQLELDLRIYLTHVELIGDIYA